MILKGDEHRHLAKVVRIQPHEKVRLFDECGRNYLARVEDVAKNTTRIVILEVEASQEKRLHLTLAQALIRSKGFELVLQKSAELGVHAFLPVLTARAIPKVEKNLEYKLTRWHAIVRGAAKQSGRIPPPEVLPPLNLSQVLELRQEAHRFFLSEHGGILVKDILNRPVFEKTGKGRTDSLILLVGPEGGWTNEEAQSIVDHGYEAISLGRFSLRAETASIACLAMMSLYWNI